MTHLLQPTIVLLKEGTDTSQGKAQLISNINACQAVSDSVRTTLGPRGMDKLVIQSRGKSTISNDGATILRLLDIVHPAAKTLAEIAHSQDSEVGDGTTSVVLLAGELLKEAKYFVEDGVHPKTIIKAYRQALQLCKEKINELAVSVNSEDNQGLKDLLKKCAATTLNSKLIASKREFFSQMVVDAVMHLDSDLSLELIGIKKQAGGSMEDSVLVEGVAFKKTFSYAGFEQMPKRIENPKILLLNIELELKNEKDNAEIKVDKVENYHSMVEAEWKIIYEKLDKIAQSGANVVLSRLAVGDLATQYFADRNIFSAGRVTDDDMKRMSKATGAQVQTTVNNLIPGVAGKCALFEEKQVGSEKYNFFSGCPEAKTATILLRGGGDQFNDEAERSMHDAIMIVRRARKLSSVVAGGGAIEMELSKYLKEYSRTVAWKSQMIINSYAKALEVIPRQLADNAGFDSIDILNKLRQKHYQGSKWFGVDMANEGVCDTFESFVWEPSLVKLNSLTAATEAACMILSVDETVRNPSNDPNAAAMAAPGH